MFKIGDKVICIEYKYTGLEPNKIYTVEEYKKMNYTLDHIILMEEPIKHFYSIGRFVSLKEYRKQKLQKICSKKVTK